MSTASLRERGTAMTDDEIVEVMARGMYEDPAYPDDRVGSWDDLSDFIRDNWRTLARPALAALRKAGCEVVQWRPDHQNYNTSLTIRFDADNSKSLVARHLGHFCTLTGPEKHNG